MFHLLQSVSPIYIFTIYSFNFNYFFKILTIYRMRTIIFSFLMTLSIISGCFFTAQAQNRRYTGFVFDDNVYNLVPRLPRYEGGKYNKIPLKVSLRPYTPIPFDQGTVGSCVAYASGYANYTMNRAIQEKLTDRAKINPMAHSASYLYNQIKSANLANASDPCSGGASIMSAMETMKTKGICLATTFANDPTNCQKTITPEANAEAAIFKIKDFATLFAIQEDAEVKIDKTRKAIANQIPVVIGIEMTPSFWDIKPGQTAWKPAADERRLGGHAMIVVGYDEVRKSFEVMNSWGATWADNGFVWIDYEIFGNFVKYGFQMTLDDKKLVVNNVEVKPESKIITVTPPTKIETFTQLGGDFIFRYPTGYDASNKIEFQEAKAMYNSDRKLYELVRKDFKKGDVFQLVAENIPQGKYAYVFSLDASNKLEKHWPVGENYIIDTIVVNGIERFNKVPIANFIPSKNTEIIMPSLDDALQMAVKGEDNLCILYCDKQIMDIDQRLMKVKMSKAATFNEKLNAAFGDVLVKNSDVKYRGDKMSFTSQSKESKNAVVPIVLSAMVN
jgi:Papain family cysteine protease